MSQLKLQLKYLIKTTIFLLSLASAYSKSSTKNFNFSSFPPTLSCGKDLICVGNSSIHQNAIQLTPDSGGSSIIVNKLNTFGRVLLPHKFKLWKGTNKSNSSEVASFNSSFLINVFRQGDYPPGEGLAFIIAPNLEIPSKSYGEYLGLTNSSTDGNPNNKLVAIELDTNKQSYDPDANHVGLNLNSIKSNKTESLSEQGIEIAPNGTVFNNVWVNYDGVAKIITVYIANQPTMDGPTPPRPDTPLLQAPLDLRDYVAQDSYFGFSASTGDQNLELNCVLRWNFTVLYFPDDKAPVMAIALGVGVPVVVLLLVGAGLLGWCAHRRRMKERGISSNILGALRSLPGTPREFEFKDLKKATNNFDDKFKLGQGGYGVVYRAALPDENLEAAVKWFSRESLKGEDDFLAELTIINRLRHRHLVRLLGWCLKNGKLLLLYEYMPNGSLDMHLFVGPEKPPLPWPLRYKILSGVASGLHYLHNEYDVRVVHRDVKASNIMLDSDFNARLGDFGLARALDNEKTSYMEAEGVLGTVGYIAPECFHTGRATQRSDVYAFGAVLIEVVCGQRPGTKNGAFQFLVDWVWSLYRDGRILDAVDKRLGEEYVVEEAEKVLLLGLACSHPIASERPKTQTIVQILSGNAPVPHVPPFKPAFVWPAMPEGDITEATSLNTTSLTTSNLGSGWSPLYISKDSYTDWSTV